MRTEKGASSFPGEVEGGRGGKKGREEFHFFTLAGRKSERNKQGRDTSSSAREGEGEKSFGLSLIVAATMEREGVPRGRREKSMASRILTMIIAVRGRERVTKRRACGRSGSMVTFVIAA